MFQHYRGGFFFVDGVDVEKGAYARRSEHDAGLILVGLHGVFDAGAGEIELDMPGLLGRARLVESRTRQEGRFSGMVARAAGQVGPRNRSSGSRRKCRGRPRTLRYGR